jgi:protein-S-isoprenylcysteine O-methyltransferase Ste14
MQGIEFRIVVAALVVTGAVIFRVAHRQAARTGRTMLWDHARRAGTLVSRLFGVLFVAGYLAGIRWLDWSYFGLPPAVSWLGGAVGVASLGLFVLVFLSAQGGIQEPGSLVTRGIYAAVRHPFYAVGFLWFASIGLVMQSWVVMAASITTLIVNAARIPGEERGLAERYDADWHRYAGRTGALLPRLPGRRTAQRDASGSEAPGQPAGRM